MIDDGQWNPIRSTQQRMLLDMWLDSTPTPLVLEIGASRAVATVRNFTRRMQRRGSPLIRINLHEADIHNPNDIELALGAKDALKRSAHCFRAQDDVAVQGIDMPRLIHTIDHIACTKQRSVLMLSFYDRALK